MDLSSPSPTTNPLLTPVFGDNVQDLLNAGALNVNPTGIIVVNSIADQVDDSESGVTTLRDAINQANADNGSDLIVFERSLFSNAQTIGLNLGELDITHNLDIIAPKDSLTGGDLVTVSGNKASRVFDIEAGATVSIDGLIFADGFVTGDNGGGIKNSGTLTLDSSIVSNNSAFSADSNPLNANGSGIYNSGNLTVNNSTISGNHPYNDIGHYPTVGYGGGISNSTSGILNVNNSTISNNSVLTYGGGIYNNGILNVSNSTISGNAISHPTVGSGGGIYNNGILNVSNSTISNNFTPNNIGSGGGIYNGGTLNVSNSTIISNYAANEGGGIYNASNSNSVEIVNSTLSGNTAFYGGGIYNLGIVTLVFSTLTHNLANQGGGVFNENRFLNGSSGSTNAGNTIIAGNLLKVIGKAYGVPLINPDVFGTFTSNGYNLIGDSTGSQGFGAIGDIVGTKDNPIDPRLAPLDNNGGSTQTIALLPDSPAIDAGDPTVLLSDPTTDQRGFSRRATNGTADIGAFELGINFLDLLSPTSTTNLSLSTSLTPVFGDNVQDLLNAGALNVNPTGIIVVNSIADQVDESESGVITLRDAINQANADNGSDLIVFERSLFSSQQTITLNLGRLDITHNLDIIAPMDSLTGGDLVTVSGNKASGVFEIESGAAVSIDGLIVADGNTGIGGISGGITNLGTITVNNSIISGNKGFYGGGGISGGSITVNNSIISGNSAIAHVGGGIFGSTITVNNSTISGNSASASGGGIYGDTITVNNSIISGNRADFSGGGISTGGGTVTNSTISGNYLSGPYDSFGGGISNNGTLTVSNSTISGNSVSGDFGSGGGISNSGTVEVNNSTISGNSTSFQGGGISNSGTMNVGNSTISDNSATSDGGGIYSYGTVEVNNSTISGNSASDHGGGIYHTGGTMTVNNSTISGNSTSFQGGGIFHNGGTMTVNNSTISANIATGFSSGFGGGIYNNSGTINVGNSTISGNTASRLGGGIYNGGVIDKGFVALVFSTLTLNSASLGGGMFNDAPSFVSVGNIIIAANLTTEDGVNPDVSGTYTSNGYNLIGDSTGSTGFDETIGDIVGTGDNPIDPRLAPLDFYGGSTQTIALLPDSPAIGAADPTLLDTDPITDQRGFSRRATNGTADIGAFEFS